MNFTSIFVVDIVFDSRPFCHKISLSFFIITRQNIIFLYNINVPFNECKTKLCM